MRLRVVAAAVLIATCLTPAPQAATAAPPTRAPALSSYVVTLAAPGPVGALVDAVVGDLTDATITHVYRRALRGFAVTLPTALAPLLRLDPRVAAVETDLAVTGDDVQRNPPWGLDRVDQARRPLDRRFVHERDGGRGAHVYVVDTGLTARHPDFRGRVGTSRNFVRSGGLLGGGSLDPGDTGDCNGHGTHVASTAVGTRYGVAKAATVHAVRVLDCQNSGQVSTVVAGLDWVLAHHQPRSVVNLSIGTLGLLGPSRSEALETAVRRLVQDDVAVAVAAGNDDLDACRTSPSAEPAVLTVGATTRSDVRASFSNRGRCLDLFAPGVDVVGADNDGSGSATLSGTSMASPHVAGALAVLRARDRSLTAAQVQRRLVAAATTGVVADRGSGSPDRLLLVPAPVSRLRGI